MEMFKAVCLFLIGLVCLIKGGDWFVDGSVGVARRFRVPELLIGATIVSIGTTLPEVMVSVTSAIEGYPEMSYGNAIGSVICNTALIAAVTLAVRPGTVHRPSLRLPVIFFFAAALLYCAVSYFSGDFSRPVGIALLLLFLVYLALSVRSAKRSPAATPAVAPEGDGQTEPAADKPAEGKLWRELLFLIVGAALIALGARLLVDNGVVIATVLGVPSTVIALTFIALGTSLPELITAITSLIKGHSALSLGNIIGANLFNLVLVSGMSMTVRPFHIPETTQIGGLNASLAVDLPLMMVVMLILTIPALVSGRLRRWQGILLLILYAGFCAFQFTV